MKNELYLQNIGKLIFYRRLKHFFLFKQKIKYIYFWLTIILIVTNYGVKTQNSSNNIFWRFYNRLFLFDYYYSLVRFNNSSNK